jgi:subtilisin-like proprotein convertase family protein
MVDKSNPTATTLRRGGKQISLERVADRFTVRMRPGVTAEKLASALPASPVRKARRQRLQEFAVEPAKRDKVMKDARGSGMVDFASHVYNIEGDPDSRLLLTDQVTAKFKAGVADKDLERIARELGLALLMPVKGEARAYVFQVTAQAAENPLKLANRLAAMEEVEMAEPNVAVALKRAYTPSDTLFPQQWHLYHAGGPFLAAGSHVSATTAWDTTRGERGVVVAIADDSVDLSHVDFQAPGKIVAPLDIAGQDLEPLPESADDNHGTSCAGVAVAEETGSGVVGAAPGCALMPIRTSGYLDDASIEALFEWVIAKGAAVVSCSWGAAARYWPLSMRQSAVIRRAATEGRGGLGCVVVFAAGNENRPVNGQVDESGWPGGVPAGPFDWLAGYAAHPDVIAVAACTSESRKSAYSNWGDEIWVCAPSNNAGPQTYPRITQALSGRGIVTTDRVGAPGYSTSDYTYSFGGTSSACPLVAGVAALVLSANPALSALELKEVLRDTADKIEDPEADLQLKKRLGRYTGGHSPWFGHGKVNAAKAVAEAVRRKGAAAGLEIRKVVTVNLAIPDNSPAGIESALNIPEHGRLISIEVKVDIRHTWRGDLVIALVSPNGAVVELQRRKGDGEDDVHETFNAASTPGLRALTGIDPAGDWRLRVQDLAQSDVGTLDRWELAMACERPANLERIDIAGVRIPDNNSEGVERTLTLEGAARVGALQVAIDITHPWIGDLTVELTSPKGTKLLLHNREGGSADNLIAEFGASKTSGVNGEELAGDWKLKVADRAAKDKGKLNRWSLRFS